MTPKLIIPKDTLVLLKTWDEIKESVDCIENSYKIHGIFEDGAGLSRFITSLLGGRLKVSGFIPGAHYYVKNGQVEKSTNDLTTVRYTSYGSLGTIPVYAIKSVYGIPSFEDNRKLYTEWAS
jgi:hypothetical protein